MGLFDKSDPAVRATYDRLLIRVRRIGPVTAEQNKTSIHLKSRAAFAGVHPLKSRLDVSIDYQTYFVPERQYGANLVEDHYRRFMDRLDALQSGKLAGLADEQAVR